MKLALVCVVVGALAGAGAFAEAGSKLKIDGGDVINGSLTIKDFHKGQIPSLKQFKRLAGGVAALEKSSQGQIDALRGDLGAYIKGSDADSRYRKLSEPVVTGEGSLSSATKLLSSSPSGRVPLMAVPGLISIEAENGKPRLIYVRNDSGIPISHGQCGSGINGGFGVTQPGQHFLCELTALAMTVQLWTETGEPIVASLTASVLPIGETGTTEFTAQVLAGG